MARMTTCRRPISDAERACYSSGNEGWSILADGSLSLLEPV